MNFKFESLGDISLIYGTSYLTDFTSDFTQENTAIIEGKLLTVFGEPAEKSENYENATNYVIRATSDDGACVILSLYNQGVFHVGCASHDDLALAAAEALAEYVNAAAPADYERTVYYLDADMQIDISVKNGNVTINTSFVSEEKAEELFRKWYRF